MDINEYCKTQGVTRQNLAKLSGVGVRTMTKISAGKKVSCAIAMKIDRATHGAVKAEDICYEPEKVKILKEFQ